MSDLSDAADALNKMKKQQFDKPEPSQAPELQVDEEEPFLKNVPQRYKVLDRSGRVINLDRNHAQANRTYIIAPSPTERGKFIPLDKDGKPQPNKE